MSIEFYEVTDPFAMDFGLNILSKTFIEGKNLRSYISEECNFYNKDGEVLDGTYIPSNSEMFYVSYDIDGWLAQVIVQIIISIVIGLIMSAIFAPEELDLSDNRPKYATYLWGKGKTKSESMLSVPILLGKFPLYANLISSRSKTEIHEQSIHTLYDNINLLYGLCANKLSNLDTFYISGIDAKSYHSDQHEDMDGDLAVFYTKGDKEQLPIQAFPYETDGGTVISSYPVANPSVFRYGDLDNEPLNNSECLLPDFSTEFYPGWVLEKAKHTIKDARMSYEALEALNGDIEFLGVCDVDGNLKANSAISSDLTTPFYIKISNRNVSLEKRSIDCSDKTLEGTDDYDAHCYWRDSEYEAIQGVYEGVQYWVEENVDRTVAFGEGVHILEFTKINVHTPGSVLQHEIGKSSFFGVTNYWTDAFVVEKVSYHTPVGEETEGWGVLEVKERTNSLFDIEVGRHATKALIEEKTIELHESRWYAHLTTPGESLQFTTTSTFGVEDIIFNFAALKGFFSRDVRTSNPVRYFGAWVSLEYKVTQRLGGTIIARSILSPITTSGKNRPPTYLDARTKNPKYITGCYKESFMFEQSIAQLLTFEPLENNWHDSPITTDGVHNLIELTDEGLLPSRNNLGQVYTYDVEVREYSHGMDVDSKGYYDVWYAPTDEQKQQMSYRIKDDTPPSIVTDLKVHRITEVNYKETLNYPGISLLGLSINATSSLNNSLPDIQAICSNSIRCTETSGNYKDWGRSFSNNPAYLCLDILYDTFYGASLGGSTLSDTKDSEFLTLVDVEKFKEFAEYCDEPINISLMEDDPNTEPCELINGKPKRHVCNGVIDDDLSIWEVLIKILKSASAKPVLIGKKISVTWEQDYKGYNVSEKPVLLPSTVFTSSNIVKGSLTETFQSLSDYVHSASGNFYDAGNKYTQTACNLNIHDYNTKKDLTKELSVDLFGITNKYRAHRKLLKAIRSSNLPRHIFKFKTSLVGLNLAIGDVVGLNYELIDWGVNSADPETLSGRILSSTSSSFTLDKDFTQTNWDDCKFLAFNPGSNSFEIYNVTGLTFTTGTATVSVSSEVISPVAFPTDSIYLIGKSNLLYKEVIILETSFDNNSGLTEVKAYEYSYDLFELDDFLQFITDSGDYNYNEVNCAPRNFKVTAEEYEERENKITLGSKLPVILDWAPPLIATGNKTEEVEDPLATNLTVLSGLKVPVYAYEIYRKIGNLSSQSLPLSRNWQLIAKVDANTLHYLDDDIEYHVALDYRVRPIFVKSYRQVTIPSNWCPVDSIYVDVFSDFLSAPIVDDISSVANIENPDYFDIICKLKNNKEWVRTASSEFYGLWVARRNNTNTNWLGPLNITLTADCEVDDTSIQVSSIEDLPKDDNGQVCCILVINYEDVVFIKGHSNKTLYIANTDAPEKTALKLFKPHKAGESVRSRHHGFFPIRVFATSIDNGLIHGVSNNTSTSESIYVYDFRTNRCNKRLPNAPEIANGVKMWDYQVRNDNNSAMWRAQNCTDRTVVTLQGISFIVIDGQTFFSFTHGVFPKKYNELTFATGGLTQDYAPVQIYSVFRGVNNQGVEPATLMADGSLIAKIQKVGKVAGEHVVIGAQHLIVEYNNTYGYTSYIKEV